MNMIHDLSNFIFAEDKAEKSDIIMIVGGTYPEPAEKAAELYKTGFADKILASGKYSKKIGFFPGSSSKKDIYNEEFATESDFFKSVMVKSGVPAEKIICENQSQFTYENACFAAEALKSMDIKKAILCCQAFHARRAFMYYQIYFPTIKFMVIPADTQNITKENWYKSQHGIDTVMSELSRIGEQFKDNENFTALMR